MWTGVFRRLVEEETPVKHALMLGMIFLLPVCGMFAQPPSLVQKPLSKVELSGLED
jgi:hypothetical protein